jgi:redox-sensitive bicupin YhaK (pirin superfamily)
MSVEAGVSTTQSLPASYSTFIYVLEGSVQVGETGELLKLDQVGWLDRFDQDVPSELLLTAGASGARFVIYSGKPQGDPIVSQGPFIADTKEDIQRLYREYREGKMPHITTVPAEQQIAW